MEPGASLFGEFQSLGLDNFENVEQHPEEGYVGKLNVIDIESELGSEFGSPDRQLPHLQKHLGLGGLSKMRSMDEHESDYGGGMSWASKAHFGSQPSMAETNLFRGHPGIGELGIPRGHPGIGSLGQLVSQPGMTFNSIREVFE
jgi:hypothetical protein